MPPGSRKGLEGALRKLRSVGALIGIAGLPVQVRNPDAAGVETRDGPFMSSALPIAGFAVIEAADLAEAVQKVSQVPCAVAHGVVEIWPLDQFKHRRAMPARPRIRDNNVPGRS